MKSNFSEKELNFIMSAMQLLSSRQEMFLQQQCNCDSRQLYAKLFDLSETFHEQQSN